MFPIIFHVIHLLEHVSSSNLDISSIDKVEDVTIHDDLARGVESAPVIRHVIILHTDLVDGPGVQTRGGNVHIAGKLTLNQPQCWHLDFRISVVNIDVNWIGKTDISHFNLCFVFELYVVARLCYNRVPGERDEQNIEDICVMRV